MLLIFIASAVTFSAAEFSVFVPNGSVSERKGSSAVLPCGLTPALNAKMFDLRWYKNDYNNPVLLYKDLKVQENPGDAQYRGRVSLIGELDKGNVSLRLENLTLADGGEYVCFVKSDIWYEKASVNLIVRVLGSFPLFSLAEFGDQVNVSCASTGWSPKPTLTWRDKRGRELATSHIYYKTDSEGLVSVSSWLLFSPSESEWISCSVGLSDQEMVDSRVQPVKGFWRKAFISILVFSLIIIIILTAVLLERQGLLPHCSFQKKAKAAVKSEESIPAEALPLTDTSKISEYLENGDSMKERASDSRPHTGVSSQSSVPPVSAKERLQMWNKLKKQKEKLTVDPDTRHRSLTVTRDGTVGVYFGKLSSSKSADTVPPFPPVLSKEGFSSGQKYWEVTVNLKTKCKLSWCVGVTQTLPSEETLTALCYEEHCGIYPSTDPHTQIPAEGHVKTLGLILDFKHKTLSFINVDKESHLHTFRMSNMSKNTFFALISPGTKDSYPVKFS
ncbi:butyrophilin subfamily 1 member A1-like isoform X1 [Pygocentrus nattereri]|uniref:Ig-like domain-containing protein n=2 Tax=Pygocentrus nattereri TaxID=42514 RepID=A0A3B4DJN8_PYGNA|nr:butyrophilin subfamily 1 member A1-like isoform X1 [Pygocentrus nattereri]